LSELKRIDSQEEAEEIARRLADALIGSPTVRPAKTQDTMNTPEFEHQKSLIQYVLSELLNNALTHAQRHGFKGKARVWTAAQYYPSSDKVRLAVADTGCGLLATLKGHPQLESDTHFAAISAALQPRVSCNRSLGVREDTVNEGIGLTTVHRLVDRGAGDMLVMTGNAYQRQGGGGFLPSDAKWQGVSRSRSRCDESPCAVFGSPSCCRWATRCRRNCGSNSGSCIFVKNRRKVRA